MPTKSALLVLLAILLTAFSLPGFAQDERRPQNGQPAADQEELIDLDFKGGSAADYLNTIRKTASDANIVVMNDMSQIAMPATQLRRVNALSALQVLSSIPRTQQGKYVEVRVEVQSPARMGLSGEPVYVISSLSSDRQSRSSGPRELSVMEISQILASATKPDDVLSIVESALQMFEDEFEPAEVRFHEGTGILIVRGQSDQVGAVQRVVSELRDKLSRQAAEEQNARKLPEARDQITHLELKLVDSANTIQTLMREVIESRTRSELLEKELEMTKSRLYEQEAEFRAWRLDLESKSSNSNSRQKPE